MQREQGRPNRHPGGDAIVNDDQVAASERFGQRIAKQPLAPQQFLLLRLQPSLLTRHALAELGSVAIAPHRHATMGDGADGQLRPLGICHLAHRPGGHRAVQSLSHRHSHRNPAAGQGDHPVVVPLASARAQALSQGQTSLMTIAPEGRMHGHGQPD